MTQPSPALPAQQKGSHAGYVLVSYLLLGLALVAFVLTSVILDSALSALSLTTQRIIVLLTLILPSLLGAVTSLIALFTTRQHRLAALGALLLNGLFAAFFLAVLAIAG